MQYNILPILNYFINLSSPKLFPYEDFRDPFISFLLNIELYDKNDIESINSLFRLICNVFEKNNSKRKSLLNLYIFEKIYYFRIFYTENNDKDSDYFNLLMIFINSFKEDLNSYNIVVNKLYSLIFKEENIKVFYSMINFIYQSKIYSNLTEETFQKIFQKLNDLKNKKDEKQIQSCYILIKILFDLFIIGKIEDEILDKIKEFDSFILLNLLFFYVNENISNEGGFEKNNILIDEKSIEKLKKLVIDIIKIIKMNNFPIYEKYDIINNFIQNISSSKGIIFNQLFDENYSLINTFYDNLYKKNKEEGKNQLLRLSNNILFFHPKSFIYKFLSNLNELEEKIYLIDNIILILKKNKISNDKEEKKSIKFNRNMNIINSLIYIENLVYIYKLYDKERIINLIITLIDLILKTGLIFSPFFFTTLEIEDNNKIKKHICEIIIDLLFTIQISNEELKNNLNKICFPDKNNKNNSLFFIIDSIKNITEYKNNTPISNVIFKKIQNFNKNYFQKIQSEEELKGNLDENFNFTHYYLGKLYIEYIKLENEIKFLNKENKIIFIEEICEKILENAKSLTINADIYSPNDNYFEYYNEIKKIIDYKISLDYTQFKDEINNFLEVNGNFYKIMNYKIYAYKCFINEDKNNNNKKFILKTKSNKKVKKKEENNNEYFNKNYNDFHKLNKDNSIISIKKELFYNIFSTEFKDIYFYNEKFKNLKLYFISHFEIEKKTKVLNYPSKLKNYSFKGYPPIFLIQDLKFFNSNTFRVSHTFFEPYKNSYENKILLHKKNLKFLKEKNKFLCELISVEKNLLGSIKIYDNYLMFETEKSSIEEIKNNKILYEFSTSFYSTDKEEKEKRIIIFFSEIKYYIEERFIFQKMSLEFNLKNGKSYYFNFLTKANYNSFKNILEERKIKIYNKDISKLQLDYKKRKITTFQFLLKLNKYSSRTYNDVTQYPIIPWLLSDYNNISKKQISKDEIRLFKYPISLQTKMLRDISIENYDDNDDRYNFNKHNGTHYSTSSYIFYYLMRQNPFMKSLIKLHSYSQENPNRMFLSIERLNKHLIKGADNREIIPQFFLNIECFINLNCSDFNKNSKGIQIDDVNFDFLNLKDNKPFSKFVFFIIKHYILLNGESVIDHKNSINFWIDNIFGINQIPENNLRESCNLFNKYCYEKYANDIDELIKSYNNESDSKKKKMIYDEYNTIINSILAFGIVPVQILKKKCLEKNEINYDFEKFKMNKINSKNILHLKIYEDNIVYLEKKNNTILLKDINGFTFNLTNSFQIFRLNNQEEVFIRDLSYSYLYFMSNNIKTYITCRFIDDYIMKIHSVKDINQKLFIKDEFINCIQLIPKTEILLLGTKSGRLIKYNLENNKIINSIKAHSGMINILEINNNLKAIISSGNDNYIYIRKLYDFELLTVIKIPDEFFCKKIVISEMNLIYCLCYYQNISSNNETYGIKSKIFGYTINGILFSQSDNLICIDFFINENFDIVFHLHPSKGIQILNGFNLTPKCNFRIDNINEYSSFFIFDKETNLFYFQDENKNLSCSKNKQYDNKDNQI